MARGAMRAIACSKRSRGSLPNVLRSCIRSSSRTHGACRAVDRVGVCEVCPARGGGVVVCPFFLGPGKHWTQDIPRLTHDAAKQFPGTHYHVTKTLGIDDLILDLLEKLRAFMRGLGLPLRRLPRHTAQWRRRNRDSRSGTSALNIAKVIGRAGKTRQVTSESCFRRRYTSLG